MLSLATDFNETKVILYENFYSKNRDTLSLSKAVILEGAGLKPLLETFGFIPVYSLIAAMIDNYCSKFNVLRNMTQSQIEDLAADLTLDFKKREGTDITLEELTIFFDRAAKGEFIRNGKKLVPFDRIDRGLIEDLLDFYFETDRTAAVWNVQDERENKIKEAQLTAKAEQEARNAAADAPKSIDELIKGKSHLTAKGLKELHEKYGK
jgi:hypothetical protein